MPTRTFTIEELIGDDPEMMAKYEKALWRIEFRRRWGSLIGIAVTVLCTASFVLGCFVIAQG